MMTQRFVSNYVKQVEMLIEAIPYINHDLRFAIKGGTAINMFLLNMPRLSVDIDLCYLPLTQRYQALQEIGDFVKTLSTKLIKAGYKVREKRTSEGYESSLFYSSKGVEVKVEINLVVRGAVFNPTVQRLTVAAIELFDREVEVQCLDKNDLFGGKICAALDRQHPRDLFDMKMFFENHSYNRELHQTFMVYLLSSKRPISELINPNILDIKSAYENQFKGMTAIPVSLEDLEKAREETFRLTASYFNDRDKEFLMSFKKGEPAWELFPIDQAKALPAVQWKLNNIKKMDSDKRRDMLKNLEKKLT